MTAVHEKALPKWLCLGARVVDTSTDREGVVHGIGQPYSYEESPSCVWLLPPGGGFEWSTEIPFVQPIDAGK
ncbi:hypothetical protein GO001_21200 [Streptomyces sp. NRRL B-1677]|uniref:hypothetical protein n=1 Tax=Streptomyces sp. NRRL B-1677 TaxID=2682966 RepID=UPI001892B686|nr:hypothetical protein [Streptomyces sp. NRRL B-1677]MBF6047729.1 hypothetical protein [Streptomyces sp. NRRL B-1677]